MTTAEQVMVRAVGCREFKTRLGGYLRRVQRGATLIITERGRPVAQVRPIRGGEGVDARLEELAALGLVTHVSNAPLKPFKPIRIRGRPISETLLEDREDRF